jgi:pimeloyl-ACP methyl ester carboxylesterase
MSGGVTYAQRGRGAPLVFLHGIGGDAACWQPQLEAFAEGYRAIAGTCRATAAPRPCPR